MSQISSFLLYLPGLIVFLVGSGQLRRYFALKRSGGASYGDVKSCQHVVKKDKNGREVYNYYNVVVEFTNPENHHKERHAVKSPSEYAIGQQVRLVKDGSQSEYALLEEENQFVLNPWEMMIIGALLILLALETNQNHEVPAMICLSLVLCIAGIALVYDYIALKKRGLQKITGEITSVYTRQISRSTKIVKGDKFTYYPVVKYTLDGKENYRRCNINSSDVKAFKVGDPMDLYYDPKLQTVFERKERTFYLVLGIILIIIAALAGLSILSQF